MLVASDLTRLAEGIVRGVRGTGSAPGHLVVWVRAMLGLILERAGTGMDGATTCEDRVRELEGQVSRLEWMIGNYREELSSLVAEVNRLRAGGVGQPGAGVTGMEVKDAGGWD